MTKLLRLTSLGGFMSILAFALALLLAPQKSQAQCGDVNNNGAVNFADITYLIDFLANEGPPPPVPANADMDAYTGISFGDLWVLIDILFSGGQSACAPAGPPLTDLNLKVIIEGSAPKGSTSTDLDLYLKNLQYDVSGFYLPVWVKFSDGSPVTIPSTTFTPITEGWDLQQHPIYDPDVALFQAFWFSKVAAPHYFIPKGANKIGQIHVTYAVDASNDRTFTYSWAPRPGHMQEVTGPLPVYPGGKNLTSNDPPDAYIPVLIASNFKRGDVNGNTTINILDLNFLVAYFFNGGSPPPILQAADVNCNNSLNVLDLNFLVAYFFNGGPAPCVP